MSGTRRIIGLPADRLVLTENAPGGRGPYRGETVEMVGFDEVTYGRTFNHGLEPGTYSNPQYPVVRTADGRTKTLGAHILEPADGAPMRTVDRASLRLRDLPGSPIWEMDKVRTPGGREGEVSRVRYEILERDGRTSDPYADDRAIQVTFEDGMSQDFTIGDVALVERGKLWRREHGEAVTFGDSEEMAEFHRQVGEVDGVTNPATGNYGWSPEQAHEALLDGSAHGFSCRLDMVGPRSCHMVTFRDPEVGEAVRTGTLERLGLAPSAPAP